MKSKAEELIDDLADVFNLAGAGFAEFYKEASKDGDSSQSASNGYSSRSASNGYYSRSASNGNYSQSASNGYYSRSASNGYYSRSASNGNYSQSASNGDSSQSASNGDSSQSASNGYSSRSASNGNYSQSASNGSNSATSALGYRAQVSGDLGNLLMASEYIIKDGRYIPVGGKAEIIDGKKLKPNRWYIVEGGEWVEVDNSDGIFGYVLSSKNGVKKIKTDSGEILFVVSDSNGNTAHGKTIKEARADLVYKNVAKFDGAVPKVATGKEWVGIYRAITGACAVGVRMFVENKGIDLDKKYRANQVVKLVEGQYGAEAFKERCLK